MIIGFMLIVSAKSPMGGTGVGWREAKGWGDEEPPVILSTIKKNNL